MIFSIRLANASEESFPDAASFNPDRFVGAVPKPFAWIPYGGGNKPLYRRGVRQHGDGRRPTHTAARTAVRAIR